MIDLSAPVAGAIVIAIFVAFAFVLGPGIDANARRRTRKFARRAQRLDQGSAGVVCHLRAPVDPLPRGKETDGWHAHWKDHE